MHCSGGAGEVSVEPTVIHAMFTADASTLVTVESHPAVSGASAGRWHALKFWDVENAGSSNTVYTVNSVVNDPQFGHITSVACHPHDAIIATTSIKPSNSKGELRIWCKHYFKRVPGAQAGSRTWHWHCRSAGAYKGARGGCEQPSPFICDHMQPCTLHPAWLH